MSEFSEGELNEMCKIADGFELQYNEFSADIDSDNPIQIILKGHLYIEHELTELLKRKLVDHTKLELDKFKFSSLYRLVFALGLLPEEIYPVIKGINDLRNNCAHDLKYTFGTKECKRIEDAFSGGFKKQYMSFLSSSKKEQTNELVKLQMILFTVWEKIKAENIIPSNIKEKLKEKVK